MAEDIIAKLRLNRFFGLTGVNYTKKNGEQVYKLIVTKEDKGYCQALKDVEAELVDNDIVEVVRCRDCQYVDKWKDREGERWFNCCMHDDELTYRFKGDDFCSWGKRRKENDN